MGDNHRDRETDRERTTIVDTGGGGGGTMVAVILVIVLLVVLLFVFFGSWVSDTSEEVGVPGNVDVSVNVGGPEVQLPDIEVPEPEPTPANQANNNS
jgi:hypothetical protein